MTQSRNRFDAIATRLDGSQAEIPEEEQERAARDFKTLCEDIQLAHMDEVEKLTGSEDNIPPSHAKVELKIPADDGTWLEVGVVSNDTDKGHRQPWELSVVEKKAEGEKGRDARYELARDESHVTRIDMDAPEGDELQRREQLARMTPWPMLGVVRRMFSEGRRGMRGRSLDPRTPEEKRRDHEEALRRVRKEAEDLIGKAQLDEQMGLNNQPVGPAEIQKLRQLIFGE